MSTPKVRVETVVGEGGSYRDAARELRVSADTRVGLTHGWRMVPAFVAEVVLGFAGLFAFVSVLSAMAIGASIWAHGATSGMCSALVGFTVLAPTLWIGANRLERRRKTWRDAPRVHDESALIIGHDALRFEGHIIRKDQITAVRVEKQKSLRPDSEFVRVDVRYNIILDVEGAKPVNVLEALQEHELADVLAALDEGGLEVER